MEWTPLLAEVLRDSGEEEDSSSLAPKGGVFAGSQGQPIPNLGW